MSNLTDAITLTTSYAQVSSMLSHVIWHFNGRIGSSLSLFAIV